MDEATPKLNEFEKTAQRFKAPTSSGDAEMVANLLEEVNALMQHLSQSGSFIGCLMAQNTEDKKAAILQSESSSLHARFDASLQKIQQDLTKTDDAVWKELL